MGKSHDFGSAYLGVRLQDVIGFFQASGVAIFYSPHALDILWEIARKHGIYHGIVHWGNIGITVEASESQSDDRLCAYWVSNKRRVLKIVLIEGFGVFDEDGRVLSLIVGGIAIVADNNCIDRL